MKYYLGLDIGSISTKGVIINESNSIVAEDYRMTEGNPVLAVRNVLKALKSQKPSITVCGAGTTGSARKLIGIMLNADLVKNEITAHALGTMTIFPDVRTIFEIGGQDSKIILIDNGVVTDYAMNTLCAAGTGSFLSSQAKRLGLEVERLGELASRSERAVNIAARCTVFAESDLVHKIQAGYKREDIIRGLCNAVVNNYLNNLCKGKRINAPIVFQGGVSKNSGVVRAFEESLNEKVYVDKNGHLMGAFGVAVLTARTLMHKKEKSITPNSLKPYQKTLTLTKENNEYSAPKTTSKARQIEKGSFSFEIADMDFETRGKTCGKCPNNCELICFYRNNLLIDFLGNRCARGALKKDDQAL